MEAKVIGCDMLIGVKIFGDSVIQDVKGMTAILKTTDGRKMSKSMLDDAKEYFKKDSISPMEALNFYELFKNETYTI